MQINNNYSVLTPVASGADVVVTGEILQITGVPPIDIRRIQNIGAGYVQFPNNERGGQWTITGVAPTAGYTYGYTVTQVSTGTDPSLYGSTPVVPKQNQVIVTNPYTAQTGDTEAIQVKALKAGLDSYINPNINLQVTNATNGTTTQTIKATAGNPILNITDRSTPGGTLTYAEILSATKAVSASTNATPTVLTIATVTAAISSGALATGNYYPIIIGGTPTSGSGVTTGNFIGKLLSATTVGLYNLDGTPVAGSATSEISATVQFPISASLGSVADLAYQGVPAGQLTAGHVYGMLQINFSQVESGGNDFPALTFTWTVYVDFTANNTYYNSFVTAIATALGALYVL